MDITWVLLLQDRSVFSSSRRVRPATLSEDKSRTAVAFGMSTTLNHCCSLMEYLPPSTRRRPSLPSSSLKVATVSPSNSALSIPMDILPPGPFWTAHPARATAMMHSAEKRVDRLFANISRLSVGVRLLMNQCKVTS